MELVFYNLFSDGNGRTARLWQTVILSSWKELFKYMPIESIIRKNPNITQTEMAKILEITRDGISYNIKILRDKGIIVRERFY